MNVLSRPFLLSKGGEWFSIEGKNLYASGFSRRKAREDRKKRDMFCPRRE